MDHMRRDEIGAEIEGYQHKIRIGFSSVTVGDVVQLISEVERLQKERDAALKQFSLDASQAQNQIDKAAAQRVEILGLQGRLWSVRESRDHARKQRDEQKEKADERGESFAKAIQDYNTMRDARDAALAEVERLKGELAEASGQVEWLDKSNNLLRTQIEGFK